MQVTSTQTMQKIKVGELLIGTRVPHEYFIVKGSGESDFGYHPGAYDVALEKAGGVQNYNHVTYSSIMPATAVRIDVPPKYDHGAVLESITAEAGNGKLYPKRLTAGIVVSKVFKNGKYLAGLVAEYNGEGTEEEAREFLTNNMGSMVERRYGKEGITTQDEFIIETIEPKAKYACALVVLGFTSYRIPLLESSF